MRKNAALFADIVINEKRTTKQEELYVKLTFTKSNFKAGIYFKEVLAHLKISKREWKGCFPWKSEHSLKE